MNATTGNPAGITTDEHLTTTPGDADHDVTDPGSTLAAESGRRMIAVGDLTAHPGNVRQDLNLNEEFCASIAAEGVRIPLLITTTQDGAWRVVEGHRRLAAALKAGLADVPCDIDPGRTGDEAGQYLDMLLANSDAYRANYTVLEETAALFAAHEAGASRTRIRKATGRTATEIKTALTAGQLPAQTKAKAAELSDQVTLEDLALLAEFDGDTDATERLLACLEHGYALEHAAERIRQDRAETAQHAKVRADLQAAGITVTDALPDGAMWLTSMRHDDQDLTPEAHAACPGHGATFQRWNQLEPAWYCTSPAEHGHTSRWTLTSGTGAANRGDNSQYGTTGTLPEPSPDPGRRLVITGNKAWHAAAQVRHRWLAASLFPRKSVPRDGHVFLARQLLAMPDPLRSGLATATVKVLFAQLTGHDAGQWEQDCGTAPAGRLAVAMLGPVITAYEHAMTEGEGRNTWRTDRYSPCPRRDAGQYLVFLASLGYHLSAIEQAVADDRPFTADEPTEDALPTAGGAPGTANPDHEPGRDGDHAHAADRDDEPLSGDGVPAA